MEAELLAVETQLSQRPAQEINDTTALTGEQQSLLDKHKVTLRIENELYLRKHPELFTLLSSFVSEVLLKQPQSIREFAADYFSDPASLQQRISGPEGYSDYFSDPASLQQRISGPEGYSDYFSDPASLQQRISGPEGYSQSTE